MVLKGCISSSDPPMVVKMLDHLRGLKYKQYYESTKDFALGIGSTPSYIRGFSSMDSLKKYRIKVVFCGQTMIWGNIKTIEWVKGELTKNGKTWEQ